MAAGHAHPLFVHRAGPLHAFEPQVKVAATFLFILAVVSTPREALWAYAVYALLLAGVTAAARVPPLHVVKRWVIEVPFVAFAVALPFLAPGERVDVAGLSLSIDGLWGAWNIIAKATLGVTATVLLASTTEVPDLLRGLDRMRVPKAFTTIAGFMVRYAEVITDEMHRMRIARISRGHDPRWIWQARAVASSAGALFIRAYERGERVHLAMLSRGYQGTMPQLGERTAPARRWAVALSVPAVAALVCVASWWLR